MGTRIAQFDSLLSGYVDPNTGLVGAGYTVYFYAAGTTTAKDVWTSYDKTGGAVTSVVLDATGSALVFGDGVYKLVVKNLSAATVDTFDGVKVQAGGYEVTTSTAATIAVTTDMDAVLLDCTSTNQVATLPLASTATRPIFFKRIATGTNTITLLPTSPDLLDGAASYTGLTTLNADVTFISDGANWYGANSGAQDADTLSGYAVGTLVNTIPLRGTDGYISGAVPAASETVPGVIELATQAEVDAGAAVEAAVTPSRMRLGFSYSLGVNGYVAFPTWLGGLIVQWGTTGSIPLSGSAYVGFPVTFPNACRNVQLTHIVESTSPSYTKSCAGVTTSGFAVYSNYAQASPSYWLAFGY